MQVSLLLDERLGLHERLSTALALEAVDEGEQGRTRQTQKRSMNPANQPAGTVVQGKCQCGHAVGEEVVEQDDVRPGDRDCVECVGFRQTGGNSSQDGGCDRGSATHETVDETDSNQAVRNKAFAGAVNQGALRGAVGAEADGVQQGR